MADLFDEIEAEDRRLKVRERDRALVDAVLDSPCLTDEEREAFEDIKEKLERFGHLTVKQREWLEGCAVRYDVVIASHNPWSSLSRAEQERLRGRDVPAPPVLNANNEIFRPAKPPHRRGG